MMMKTRLGLVLVIGAGGVAAAAPPSLDSLACKRTEDKFETKTVVMGISAVDNKSATSADGKRAVAAPPNIDTKGYLIVDAKTKKKVAAVHSKDKTYDCDSATEDDGSANSVRWLGDDAIFAQGWFCEEFDAKPYLANGKTGKFISFLKLGAVSPEASYQFAPVDGSLWAVSVFDHNSKLNTVSLVDVKTGAIKKTKKAGTDAEVAKLPDCKTK